MGRPLDPRVLSKSRRRLRKCKFESDLDLSLNVVVESKCEIRNVGGSHI